ncbi:hypothetical protein V6N13_046146 [Hibiscus sabdariffa]|uniref:non-specific serine/threonine protein kinase n=1 Tax=Hibiscus sabdariffa TaxID=183260 RepID=A0ABR2N6B3_9ROSI
MLNPAITLPCLIFSLHLLLLLAQSHNCTPFRCGRITFPFPFSDQSTFGQQPVDCGFPGYQITCADPDSPRADPVPKFMLSGQLYQVKDIFLSASDEGSGNLVTLVNDDLIRDFNSGSCRSLRNLTITASAFPFNHSLGLPPSTTNLTFFKCPWPSRLAPPRDFLDRVAFNSTCDDEQYRFYLWRNGTRSQRGEIARSFDNFTAPRDCDLVMVPVSSVDVNNITFGDGDIQLSQLTEALAAGFPLQWNTSVDCRNCNRRNEQCGFVDGARVVCVCDGGCSTSTRPRLSRIQKIFIGVGCGIFSVIAMAALLVFKNRASLTCLNKSRATSDGANAKEFIKTYRSHLLCNYSYSDIKKITNGFKVKLGRGGYGDVYKGKLLDGRIVAIKLLKSGDVISDNFVSEVATIGRIHHFNVINLFGFCWDGSKQALVYEYMPNGSLADLLSKEEVEPSLGVAKLMEIAIGVAEGIEYLHNGCESRILHLDIKPQNVLLDQNLNPKISDFGLAKVYARDRIDVTMSTARGTIGYIAPEIFMTNLGNPSHKSDVYSYGMLLLEMVFGKQRFKQMTSSASGNEAYFPEWIYEKVTEEKEIVVQADLIGRKMRMVGLWCIQMNQRDRPSMKRVVGMLNGRVEDIDMPPRPLFMLSLPRPQIFQDQTNSLGSASSAMALTLEQTSFN